MCKSEYSIGSSQILEYHRANPQVESDISMVTVYATHESYADHRVPGYQHPEHAGRIETIWRIMAEAGLPQQMYVLTPEPLDRTSLLLAHTDQHINLLDWISGQEKVVLIDQDTYALPQSFDIARRAAGAAVDVAEAIVLGKAHNGLACVRPPGHHATSGQAMGFCLLNNVALAARVVQSRHSVRRVMIIDYDVHHGNGTQDIFYADPGVLFVSIHQSPFYPGTGYADETGQDEAKGTTLNIPLGPGHGDRNYATLFEEIIVPAAMRYQPELILVSAGFDAHWADPLAQMRLSLAGYDYLARQLIKLAEELCDGRIAFVTEGGYDVNVLGHGVANIARALLGISEISDPFGSATNTEPDLQRILKQLQQIHQLPT